MSQVQLQDGIALTLNAVQMNDFLLIDDHNNTRGKTKLGAAAVYERDGKQVVVALFTKAFSDYYTINEIAIKEDGLPHLTRNACGGMIHNASMDIVNDVRRMEAGFDQAMIEKYPALKPGRIFNIVLAHAA